MNLEKHIMRKAIALTPVVVLAALSMSGCAKSPEDELAGRWYQSNGPLEMEFFSDGTVVFDNEERISGDFTVLDESNIRFDLGGMGALAGPLVVGYEIQGDSLLLDNLDGDASTRMTREDLGPVRFVPSQVEEGLRLTGGAKAAVAEFYVWKGEWPENNLEAGILEAEGITGLYVESVAIENGIITVRYGGQSHLLIHGNELVLTPSASEGGEWPTISWTCSSPSIDPEYLPAACL